MDLTKALDFLEKQGLDDCHYQDSGMMEHIAENMQKYADQQLNLYGVVSSLPTKEEMHLELSNRVEDIKATSSMGANKQMLLAYRIGFEECDDYIRKR